MAAPGGWGSASNTVYAASEASCPSYIAATAGKIRRHGPRFGFTACGVVGYDPDRPDRGTDPFLSWSFEAAGLAASSFWRSGRPLSHSTRLRCQARPRPPLAVGSAQRSGLVEVVAGEQQPLDVPAVPRSTAQPYRSATRGSSVSSRKGSLARDRRGMMVGADTCVGVPSSKLYGRGLLFRADQASQ
jgi:hypothetical protein